MLVLIRFRILLSQQPRTRTPRSRGPAAPAPSRAPCPSASPPGSWAVAGAGVGDAAQNGSGALDLQFGWTVVVSPGKADSHSRLQGPGNRHQTINSLLSCIRASVYCSSCHGCPPGRVGMGRELPRPINYSHCHLPWAAPGPQDPLERTRGQKRSLGELTFCSLDALSY